MPCVDNSVLVSLLLNEPHSVATDDWYAPERSELVVAAWCIPEFASALCIKQRTGVIDRQQAQAAWSRFERMVAADLRLLPVEPTNFHRAPSWKLATRSFEVGCRDTVPPLRHRPLQPAPMLIAPPDSICLFAEHLLEVMAIRSGGASLHGSMAASVTHMVGAPASTQSGLVLRPVRHLERHHRKVVPAFGVALVGHGYQTTSTPTSGRDLPRCTNAALMKTSDTKELQRIFWTY